MSPDVLLDRELTESSAASCTSSDIICLIDLGCLVGDKGPVVNAALILLCVIRQRYMTEYNSTL